MTCAAHCCAIQSQFDRRIAQRDLDNYRRRGPSKSTQQLLAFTRQADITSMTVLDVGGGVGVIAHELLAAGAASATVVDASAAYLAAAQEESERRHWGERFRSLQGDFVALAHDIRSAELVTLDKVVCCYPDMDRLLSAAAECSRRHLAIVYPRDNWWMHVAAKLENAIRALRRSDFRVYAFAIRGSTAHFGEQA